ncbi:unnamed protein product, partial [Ectocarpus sp. 12 AP-2014]
AGGCSTLHKTNGTRNCRTCSRNKYIIRYAGAAFAIGGAVRHGEKKQKREQQRRKNGHGQKHSPQPRVKGLLLKRHPIGINRSCRCPPCRAKIAANPAPLSALRFPRRRYRRTTATPTGRIVLRVRRFRSDRRRPLPLRVCMRSSRLC